MAYSAIIADDERELRTYLRTLLAEVWPDLIIAGEAANGQEAMALVEATHPQVAFLDIKMPGLSGMEVAKGIAGVCRIVFVTAFDQYAVEAFERSAVDYLLKPVSKERLFLTVARLTEQMASSPAPPGWPRWSSRSSRGFREGKPSRSSAGSGSSRKRTSGSFRWRR